MRLSSLPRGTVEDDSSPWFSCRCSERERERGPSAPPGEPLCEQSLSNLFSGVRGREILRTSPLSGSFVAMFSFPRTVLSLKQSMEPTQVQRLNWEKRTLRDGDVSSHPAGSGFMMT